MDEKGDEFLDCIGNLELNQRDFTRFLSGYR